MKHHRIVNPDFSRKCHYRKSTLSRRVNRTRLWRRTGRAGPASPEACPAAVAARFEGRGRAATSRAPAGPASSCAGAASSTIPAWAVVIDSGPPRSAVRSRRHSASGLMLEAPHDLSAIGHERAQDFDRATGVRSGRSPLQALFLPFNPCRWSEDGLRPPDRRDPHGRRPASSLDAPGGVRPSGLRGGYRPRGRLRSVGQRGSPRSSSAWRLKHHTEHLGPRGVSFRSQGRCS